MNQCIAVNVYGISIMSELKTLILFAAFVPLYSTSAEYFVLPQFSFAPVSIFHSMSAMEFPFIMPFSGSESSSPGESFPHENFTSLPVRFAIANSVNRRRLNVKTRILWFGSFK